MKKTRAIILGGGISGLSMAHYLKKKDPSIEITLLEKSSRLGGWLHTQKDKEFLFERGPRTFSVSRSNALLSLVKDLKIDDQLIKARPASHIRYLWHEGRLQKFPTNPLQFLFSPLTRPLLLALLKEWSIKPHLQDESIWDFAARRFSPKVAEMLFDPITTGIYAGDCKELSVTSCFPVFKKWEECGSLTKGFFALRQKKKTAPACLAGSSLFSLRGGIESLIDALAQKTSMQVHYSQEVQRVEFGNDVEVFCQDQSYRGDLLYFAMPSFEVGKLLEPHDAELASWLKEIPYKDMSLVHLGFAKEALEMEGFGYLVPRKENQEVLGAVFDSKIFAEHNQRKDQTRLTFMLEGLKDERAALNALKKHVNVELSPDYVYVAKNPLAIPQYRVGHKANIERIEKRIKERFANCHLLGNYLQGVSVNDCIERARVSASI